jgi:hypothetical protein
MMLGADDIEPVHQMFVRVFSFGGQRKFASTNVVTAVN